MRAAIYEKTGAARDVISIVELEAPQAGPGEVRTGEARQARLGEARYVPVGTRQV